MSLLTKVATGVAFGDVSNQAIRNILTEISKSIGGKFTEQEMEDTLNYFDWKCPYTGRDLRQSIKNKDGSSVTDHIYPQNKEWCGLNVKGNLIFVDKEANNKKRDKDIDTFLLNDTTVLGKLDMKIRLERLQKIKDFQKICGYNPEQIRSIVGPILKVRYDELRFEQEKCIRDTLNALTNIGIYTVANTASSVLTATNKKEKSKITPELTFHPANEEQFKIELLKKKKAYFELTYDTGIKKLEFWNAEKFKGTSNLRGNIESKTFWRNKGKEGLIKVEVFID